MKNETITILPAKALDLFLNTELPPADILDATMPLDDTPTGDPLIPGTYKGKPVAGKSGHTTAKCVRICL